MISKKIEKAINKQMNLEAFSAYIYLSMAAYFEGLNLEGFSHWMRLQAEEELGHAMRLFKYVLERDGNVELLPIKAPPATWKSPLDACQHALKHERVNTKQINDLMDLSFKEVDHATRIFLQWFVAEQVEEESSATKLAEKVRLAGKDGAAILVLDQELLKRQLGAS
ncbi:MAG: ferritin [bacterium]|nr:ferritin [bacterium]